MITNKNYIHRIDINETRSRYRLQTPVSGLVNTTSLDYHYRYIGVVHNLVTVHNNIIILAETTVYSGLTLSMIVFSFGEVIWMTDLELCLLLTLEQVLLNMVINCYYHQGLISDKSNVQLI